MFKRLVLAFCLIFVVPVSTNAQFTPKQEEVDTRDQAVVQALLRNVTITPQESGDHSTANARQGIACSKPLGQYLIEPNFEFGPDYRMVSPEIQVKFAYDLHEHLKSAGYDWLSVQKNNSGYFMPYEKQREWADVWWQRNYKAFQNGYLFKATFLYDAIVDATNIYGLYERKVSSPDYFAFENSSLLGVIRKNMVSLK